MKTNFKSIAIAILGLIVINLNAQDFTASKSSAQNHHEIALAMAPGKSTTNHTFTHRVTLTDANTFAAILYEEAEEALRLEIWMINKNSFNVSKAIELETEEPMELESWMFNKGNFAVRISIQPEAEKPLEIENWMTDEAKFAGYVHIQQEMDQPMHLESWMTNVEVFDQSTDLLTLVHDEKLEIKDWMFNSKLFQ